MCFIIFYVLFCFVKKYKEWLLLINGFHSELLNEKNLEIGPALILQRN